MIPFTQYLRPDGRAVSVTFDAPPEVEAQAKRLLDHGWRFTCEVLATGEVSFAIEGEDETGEIGDLVIELGSNDATVQFMVARLMAAGVTLLDGRA